MRNLLIVVILAAFSFCQAAENQLSPTEQKEGWKLLFDGTTTKGLRSFGKQTFPEKGWTVRDGVLRVEARSRAGDIITDQEFNDFDLRWEWRIPKDANNGVKYFITEKRKEAIGHEYQMVDDRDIKDPREKTASFYDVLPPKVDATKPAGEWNQSRVLVQGNHVEHWLNGKKVLEYELGSEEVMKGVANSKFRSVKDFGTKIRGHILLTYHNDQAEYRNIKIRELTPH